MPMDTTSRIVRNDRGIAFVVSLVTMLVLVILGYGLLVATDGSTRTETGMKAQTAAFEAADSGIELAREKLRQCLAGVPTPLPPICSSGKKTMSQMLAAAGGGVDSSSLAGFPGTSATANATGNTPLVASDSTTLSPTSFQVFLTNDPADNVTSTVDGAIGTAGHNRVTLTSFAAGANNVGYAVVQSVVEAPLEGLDGLFQATLILPGPDVTFAAPDSNPYGISNSDCKATIATTSNTARNSVYNAIPSGRRDTGHYGDGCSPTTLGVYNFLSTVPNPYDSASTVSPATPAGMPTVGNNMISIDWWNALMQTIRATATFRSASDAGFNLGTATNPQVIYIDGDFDTGGNTSGYGILAVTGNLTLHGNMTYTGLVLAVGAGNVTVSGGGNGGVIGSVVVANTTPWSGNAAYVSTPSYNANGGGTSAWGLGNDAIANIPFTALTAPRRITFTQLR